MRQMPLAQFSTLGGAINAVINSQSSICEGPEYIHLVLDSYVEISLKEGCGAETKQQVLQLLT
ncbi:hypothetical protein DPMN_111716 [Dreissena polymorpha]|uniref:Uncharacterized protein n=1 Tax=Dreissena polymorpha TaxID=45954 RepID=A0A9D4KF08_DREPO|nr:hypothetical protein DPMN_111716 [Dreissena polymorpha]